MFCDESKESYLIGIKRVLFEIYHESLNPTDFIIENWGMAVLCDNNKVYEIRFFNHLAQ